MSINRIINYLTYILFLVPFTLLIVDNNVLFPFITTKAIIFRILISFGLVLVVWLYLLTQKTFPYKNLLFIGAVLFFIANLVSTIFSLNPYRSFWGNAERMEGTWSLFFYLLYFSFLITLFQFEPKTKKTIFYSILIVTTIISLIEINQAFFLKQERPSATLGNPTYIGFMNLLMIFLIIYFLFEKKIKLISLRNIFYFLLILINFLSLIASQTRGSILGLLAGIFAGIIFYLLFSKINLKRKVLVFSLIAVFLLGFYFFLKTEIALNIPGIKRIAETLQNPSSIFPRIFAWKIFYDAFKQKPIFGWGPEIEPVAFFVAFDPIIFNYEQAIFDRPHNKFVEILVKTGIFGFITWVFLLASFVYYLIKNRTKNIYQTTSLFSFLIAYLVQNFSLFDMQASYILFFFGLSLIIDKVEFKSLKERFIRPYLILVSGLSLVFVIFHLQHYYIVRKIITYLKTPDVMVASQGFLRLSEIAGPFLTEEAIMVSNYLNSHLGDIKNFQPVMNFYNVISRAYFKDKNDYRLNTVYININLLLIQAKREAGLNYEKEIMEIKKIYQELLEKYSKMPETYTNFGNILYLLGEKENAVEILNRGEKVFQKIYPRYFLEEGLVYLYNNYPQIAYQKLQEAFKQGLILKSDLDFEIALQIYLANKDVENSKRIVNLWITHNKSNEIKKKIDKIFEYYGFEKILKLDK